MWLIALLEYCLAVPVNRIGFGQFTGFQLKIHQEAVTLTVFLILALTYLKGEAGLFQTKPIRGLEGSGGVRHRAIAATAQQCESQHSGSQHQKQAHGVEHGSRALAHARIHHDRQG
jgi:Putative member of DMT superfamily (DUF486)